MIITQKFDFKNYVCLYSKANQESRKGLLLLHGFPAESIKGDTREKNADIAIDICTETAVDTYVHHYNGLGKSSSGTFSFLDSIKDSLELFQMLSKRYDKVNLIGHSWGGLVAINIFKMFQDKVEKLFLMSPFTAIPDKEILFPILRELLAEYPTLLKGKPIAHLVEELEIVKKEFSPLSAPLIINSGNSVHIAQATDDNEVPPHLTEIFQTNLIGKSALHMMETDHSFTKNRIQLLKLIKEIISQ